HLDAGLAAFADLEDEIDAIVRQLDDLGIDADIEAAAAPIDLDQARHVGLHHGPRQRASLLRLDLRLELIVLDLLVALAGNAIDDRILDDREDEPAALHARLNVLKQTGGVERLHALVDLERIEPPARAGAEIRADGVGLHPLVTLHHDGVDGLRM